MDDQVLTEDELIINTTEAPTDLVADSNQFIEIIANQVSTKCAVCQLTDGLVINIIMALPSDPAQDGCQLIEIMADQECDIGWYWDGTTFLPFVSEAV